jgi:hypothetical protein
MSRFVHETSPLARETSRFVHETSPFARETSRFAHSSARFVRNPTPVCPQTHPGVPIDLPRCGLPPSRSHPRPQPGVPRPRPGPGPTGAVVAVAPPRMSDPPARGTAFPTCGCDGTHGGAIHHRHRLDAHPASVCPPTHAGVPINPPRFWQIRGQNPQNRVRISEIRPRKRQDALVPGLPAYRLSVYRLSSMPEGPRVSLSSSPSLLVCKSCLPACSLLG